MSARAVAEAEVLRLLEVDPAQFAAAMTARPTGPPIPVRQRGRTGKVAAFNSSLHPRGAHGMFAANGGRHPSARAKAASVKTPKSPAEIKAFQKAYGLPVTGQLDAGTRATIAAPPPQTVSGMQHSEAVAKAKAEATKRQESRAKAAANKKEREQRGEIKKGASSSSSSGSSSGSRSASAREAKAEARYAAQQQVGKLHSGQAWTGKLNVNENLTPGMGVGKNAKPSPAVALLQNKLQALGYGANTATDGKYGPQTEVAVRQLQREHGLRPTGAVGPLTMQLLEQLTQRSLQWQKQGIIEAQMLPGESVAGYTRCVLSAAMTCR